MGTTDISALPNIEGLVPSNQLLDRLTKLGVDPIPNHSTIGLGLIHRSARTSISISGSDLRVRQETFDILSLLGKTAISLFCAEACCDSYKYRTRGDASNAIARFRSQLIPAVGKALYISEEIKFSDAVTESEKLSTAMMEQMLPQLIGAISFASGLRPVWCGRRGQCAEIQPARNC